MALWKICNYGNKIVHCQLQSINNEGNDNGKHIGWRSPFGLKYLRFGTRFGH